MCDGGAFSIPIASLLIGTASAVANGQAQAQQAQAQADLCGGPAQPGTAQGFLQAHEGTGSRRFGSGRRLEQRALFPDP